MGRKVQYKKCVCVVCGNKFETKSHSKVKYCSKDCLYKSYRVQKNCLSCGKKMWVKKSTLKEKKGKYCSRECFIRRIKVNCLECNKVFETHPYKIRDGKGKYCSRECCSKHKKRNRVKAACSVCGKSFDMEYAKGTERLKSKSGKIFCSRECYYKYNRGKNVYNYNPDRALWKRIRTLSEFIEWRNVVFKRDNYACRFCETTGQMNVHHIKHFADIIKEYDIKTMDDALNCNALWDVNNGITLCVKCHAEQHPEMGTLRVALKEK